MNKKAAMNLIDNWVDYVAFGCLLLGIFFNIVAGSKVLSILIVLLSSMVIGRYIYLRKYKGQLRFWYPVIAFIIGLIVGSKFLSYKAVLLTFAIGAFIGYFIKKHHIFD